MTYIKLILTIVLIQSFTSIYANKDRLEKPQSFKFTFENNKILNLNSDDSSLKMICDEIISGKRKIKEAEIKFKNGEVISAKYNGKNWTSIKISYKGIGVNVPKNTLKKIKEIHFSTIVLVWASDNEIAFNSSYYIIEFEMGTIKNFNKLPSLELNFEGKKFINSVISKSVEENATQWSDF